MNEAMEGLDQASVEDLFKKLYGLENQFSRKLKSVGGGKQVYHEFIKFIRYQEGNILTARPYFREKEGAYKETVNYAIDHSKPKMLHDVKVNFQFCKFAMDTLKALGKESPALKETFEDIKMVRESIVNMYLRLGMNRAKGHVRTSATMDFSDLIQNSNEGLIAAVDKFILEDGTPFHQFAIGWMVAYLINGNLLNLSVSIGPHAGKKLYKIRRILEKLPNAKAEEIAKLVPDSSESEINDLIAASSYMSLDKEFEGTDLRMVDTLAHPSDSNNDPYLMVEHNNLMSHLQDFMMTLTLLEKKILTLKGVQGILTEVHVEDLK